MLAIGFRAKPEEPCLPGSPRGNQPGKGSCEHKGSLCGSFFMIGLLPNHGCFSGRNSATNVKIFSVLARLFPCEYTLEKKRFAFLLKHYMNEFCILKSYKIKKNKTSL